MIRRCLIASVLAGTVCSAPLYAEQLPGTPQFQQITPQLKEALSAIKSRSLVGVFLLIEPQQAPIALAAYLLRDHAALKRFIKKVERDLKKYKAISRWDKLTALHMIAMGVDRGSPTTGKKLSKKWIVRVQELTLAPSVPHPDLMRRGSN